MIKFASIIPSVACSLVLCALSCILSPKSSDKTITAFSIENPPVTGIIDENAKTIFLQAPEGTNIRSLKALFTTTGASVAIGPDVQVSGVTVNDFSSPLVYVVTAEDNSTATYTVTVKAASKKIIGFKFPSIPATGSIDESNKNIIVAVPSNTNVTALVATFTFTGTSVLVGSIIQESGVTANDYTTPVRYTVKGSDGTSSEYTVTVVTSVAANWTTFDWTDSVLSPTGWLDREGMTGYCTVEGGILSFNSGDIANQAHFRYELGSLMDSGEKMTLVLKARGDGGDGTLAWMLDFQSGYRGQVEIRNGQVGLQNGTSKMGTFAFTPSVMHTFMISFEAVSGGIRINVYIDGEPTAKLSGTVTAAPSGLYIRLGDMSNTNTYNGSLDWIMWTTDGAFFPGSVDMPPGFSLNP